MNELKDLKSIADEYPPSVHHALADLLGEYNRLTANNLFSDNKSIILNTKLDEVITVLFLKYNIVVYNDVEPFVDPHNNEEIIFQYASKWCNTTMGWNGRIYIARGVHSKTPILAKYKIVLESIKWLIEHPRL